MFCPKLRWCCYPVVGRSSVVLWCVVGLRWRLFSGGGRGASHCSHQPRDGALQAGKGDKNTHLTLRSGRLNETCSRHMLLPRRHPVGVPQYEYFVLCTVPCSSVCTRPATARLQHGHSTPQHEAAPELTQGLLEDCSTSFLFPCR